MLCPKCKSIDFKRIDTCTYKCQDCNYVWTSTGYILSKRLNKYFDTKKRNIQCSKCGKVYLPKSIDERKRCIVCDHIHERTVFEIETERNNSIRKGMEIF